MKIYTKEMINEVNRKRQERKKVIKIICIPFLCLIVLCIVSIFFQKFVQKKQNIDLFGYEPFMVMTGSMEPSINTGDMVIVKQVSQEEIQIDDVITYTIADGTESVTHRVIGIAEREGEILYQTKGDNNNAADPDLVHYQNILGKVTFTINGLGKTIAYIFTGTGLGAVALLVLLHYSISNDKRTREIAREEARRLYNVPKYVNKEQS